MSITSLSNTRLIRLLPRLGYFSACAKQGSTVAAAVQLNLTKGAVSQQLIKLEQELGYALFHRTTKGLELTDAGTQLLPHVEQALADIQLALAHLEQQRPIRIVTTPSLAYRWLIPQLSGFYREHPKVQVEVIAEGSLLNTEQLNADLAIDYSQGGYSGLSATKLFDEWLVPVASPQYLDNPCRAGNPWQKAVLLHDAVAWQGAGRDQEWQDWLTEQGRQVTPMSEHFFNRSDMALSAAVAGLGIALARKHLLTDEISSGQLMAIEKEQISNLHYYLLHPNNQIMSGHTQQLHQWLRAL